jgi:hypothetical protein
VEPGRQLPGALRPRRRNVVIHVQCLGPGTASVFKLNSLFRALYSLHESHFGSWECFLRS